MSFLIKFDPQQLSAFANNWRRFLTIGFIFFILGLVAIGTAAFTTLVSVIFLGIIIFLSGLIIFFDTLTFWRGQWGGFLLHLLLAILYLWVGFALIKHPIEGSLSLTFILGIFYIIAGIFRLGFASVVQMPKWGWSWLNGLITLILGILILTNWPATGLFIIGLFVGIDLLFIGIAYMMSALSARNMLKRNI